MSIKNDIRDTYQKYDNIFQKSFFRSLEDFDIAEIRDQFKIWIKTNSPIFKDMIDAEDTFLYIYHYKELQEIKRKAIYLRELEDQSNYERFIQEFFDDNSPSGLQELKVHQINNESDKIWFSREKLLNGTIEEWRAERFSAYI
tara:strand:+ start:21771 stop:22199 length:429 start_codon:yes stop_codon:yes gene_type:complete